MEKNDLPAFAQLMASLGELYGKSMSESLIELYWAALKRFELSAIRQAVRVHINHPEMGQYMLKPNDVVRYLEGSAHCKSMQAWGKVIRAMKSIGQYDSVVFDDYLIHVVIDEMGGWITLCRMLENQLPYRAREFEKRYESYLLHKPENYPRKLCGQFEATNTVKGLTSKYPVLCGNKQMALEVYSKGQDVDKVSLNKFLTSDFMTVLDQQSTPLLNKPEK